MVKYKTKPKSKYFGVRPDRTYWRASIMVDGKNLYLGAYFSEGEAAIAFNEAYKLIGNPNFLIQNNFQMSSVEQYQIFERVKKLLQSKGLVNV